MKTLVLILICGLMSSKQAAVCEETPNARRLIESEFQRGTVNWLTRDISWLNSWQFRQLSKLPTGYDVMFMIINKQPSVQRDSIMFSTYAILKPSRLLNQATDEFLAVYINDTEYSTEIISGTVESAFAMQIFNEAWLWENGAGIETQNIRLGTDENKVSYVLAGRPDARLQRTEGLLMLESINPSNGGLLDVMENKIRQRISEANKSKK